MKLAKIILIIFPLLWSSMASSRCNSIKKSKYYQDKLSSIDLFKMAPEGTFFFHKCTKDVHCSRNQILLTFVDSSNELKTTKVNINKDNQIISNQNGDLVPLCSDDFIKHYNDILKQPFLPKSKGHLKRWLGKAVSKIIGVKENIQFNLLEGLPNCQRPTFTDDELSVLKSYTLEEYKVLNPLLRAGELDLRAIDRVDLLNQTLNKISTYPGDVYRGISLQPSQLHYFILDYKVGDILEEKAFLSTSRDQSVADKFKSGTYNVGGGESGTPYLFKIKSKYGRDISEMAELSRKSEQEVLFQTGSLFRIIDIDHEIREVELEEIIRDELPFEENIKPILPQLLSHNESKKPSDNIDSDWLDHTANEISQAGLYKYYESQGIFRDQGEVFLVTTKYKRNLITNREEVSVQNLVKLSKKQSSLDNSVSDDRDYVTPDGKSIRLPVLELEQ